MNLMILNYIECEYAIDMANQKALFVCSIHGP